MLSIKCYESKNFGLSLLLQHFCFIRVGGALKGLSKEGTEILNAYRTAEDHKRVIHIKQGHSTQCRAYTR